MGNSIINTGLQKKDYAFLTATQNQTPTVGEHIEYDTIVGNLALSTGAGQANGLITLLAGRKYILEGVVFGAGNGGGAQYLVYQWYDVTNNVLLGANGQASALTYTTGDPSSQQIAKAIVSPVTNIQVELRETGANNFAVIYGSLAANTSYAYIESIEAYVPSVATFPVKAWVSFDSANAAPAIIILNSFNVAAVNYITVGVYEIVFATPMPNVNYATFCTAVMSGSGTLNSAIGLDPTIPQTVNSVTVMTKRSDATYQDEPVVNVMIIQ
jgi:hypothetical protein